MNRLTLRITVGLLAAVVVATLAVQLFMSWQMSRAISAARLAGQQMVCVASDGMPGEDRREVQATLEPAGVAASPSASRPRAAIMFGPSLDHPVAWPSLLMLLAGVAAFVVGVGAFLTRPVLKRLQLLDDVAGRIATGELGARVPVSGHDPIAQFAFRFNQMAERNQRLLEGQRHLLQAVSHELRTPAARIRFGLEMMRETDDEEAQERYRTGIDADVDEIDALVEELLALNRLDGAGVRIESQRIDVVAVVHEECAMLAPLRPGIGMALPALEGERFLVHGSERLFRRVIRNLVSNALRHARQRVVVTVSTQGDHTRLCVDDDGPGVPPSDRTRIFEPFIRLDESRSRESGGFGLGLAIVDRIVRAHSGSLAVEDAPGGGARFALSWPVGT
jgi:two-component system, OmpR family, sensor histidine kinase RstB